MSYASRKTRPDSKDTAKLRAEYLAKVRQFQESKDPASKSKLKDDKQKAFQRVVDQMNGERNSSLAETHKVLIGMGKLKTEAQMKEEREKQQSNQAAKRSGEGR